VKQTRRLALAAASTALCAAVTTGCGALHAAPVSNAKANSNPAVGRSDTYENLHKRAGEQKGVVSAEDAAKQAEADRKETEQSAEKAKEPPTDVGGDMQAVASTSELPAWVTAINWASTKLGHKYVWGGESDEEGGFDCSGLMQASYAQAGIKLPRVANDQYATTKNHPAEKDLRMGDLVFFGDSPRGIHHVGLYVGRDGEGNPMMLHAPNSRSKIRFDKVHYMSDYYGATRVIP
jgi:cell wall-associated NlpC family hydrolase